MKSCIYIIIHIWLITDTITPNQAATLNSEHPGGGRAIPHYNQGPLITSQVIPKKRWKSHRHTASCLNWSSLWHINECVWGAWLAAYVSTTSANTPCLPLLKCISSHCVLQYKLCLQPYSASTSPSIHHMDEPQKGWNHCLKQSVVPDQLDGLAAPHAPHHAVLGQQSYWGNGD